MKVEVTVEEVNKIFDHYVSKSRIDPESGALLFGDLPVIWSRASFMSNIYTELESLVGQSASSVLKRIGRSYGKTFYELISTGDNRIPMDDKEQVYRYICAETQAIGWGQITIEEVDDQIIITSKGFASARNLTADQKQEGSPDAYFMGYFEGLFSEMHGKRYTAEDVSCVAKGDSQCKFLLTTTPQPEL
ncbi:MAG: hypothetical protein KAX31_07015 [Thermoplasmata archaeon]|nr:hypothetical protein [Thermoplasmata archaeon]